MLKKVTIVYDIIDENQWGKSNPLGYCHNGLRCNRVYLGDKIEDYENAMIDEKEHNSH